METPGISPLIRFLDKIITQSLSSIEAHYQKSAATENFDSPSAYGSERKHLTNALYSKFINIDPAGLVS